MDAGFYQFPEITGWSEQWSIARATWKMKERETNCERARANKFVSLSRACRMFVASGEKKKKKIRHRRISTKHGGIGERARFSAHINFPRYRVALGFPFPRITLWSSRCSRNEARARNVCDTCVMRHVSHVQTKRFRLDFRSVRARRLIIFNNSYVIQYFMYSIFS